MEKNLKGNASASEKWSGYYMDTRTSKNYHPENFISRIFTSKSPVCFIEDNYVKKRILDLGCGHGRHIPYLNSLGFDVCGMEVSKKQVDELSKIFTNNVFIMGDSSNIPIGDNQLDYIMACNSIYYVEGNSLGFSKHIVECARVLIKDGRLIFSMLGDKHSIFKNSVHKEDNIRLVVEDFLNFRNGVLVRPYLFSDRNEDLFPYFKIEHQGEIIETVGGYCRHIHYFVAINEK